MADDDDEEPDLFGSDPPFSRPGTSEEAAESVKPLTGKWRKAVYDFIKERGDRGATCDEVERVLERRHQNISARIWELHNSYWIGDSGRRRKTRSLRDAIVWIALR